MSRSSPGERASQPKGLARLFRYLIARFALDAWLRRAVLALGRRFRPFKHREMTVDVLRWPDVRSVLERAEDFSVAIYDMRMKDTMGLTSLGMDPSDQYAVESGAMRAALEVPDARRAPAGPERAGRLPWVRSFAAALSRQCVEEALKRRDEIDVVSDLADFVPLHFALEFFGTPEPNPARPEILHWLKQISHYVFATASSDWAVPAHRAGQSIAAHFRRLVARRHAELAAGVKTPDDVLGRLIAAHGTPVGLSDDAIARSLGFISGATMPTSWLFIEAVDRLLRLPRKQRKLLHEFAVQGDRAAVRAYVIEAARFFPFPFMIVRYAEQDTEIAGHPIAKGTTVNLVIGSATMDRRAGLEHPGRFIPGRPESQYMLFGHSTHLCQGKDIAEEVMTEMAIALFSRENLRRARGLRGYICMGPKGVIPDGGYPQNFILKADG